MAIHALSAHADLDGASPHEMRDAEGCHNLFAKFRSDVHITVLMYNTHHMLMDFSMHSNLRERVSG